MGREGVGTPGAFGDVNCPSGKGQTKPKRSGGEAGLVLLCLNLQGW